MSRRSALLNRLPIPIIVVFCVPLLLSLILASGSAGCRSLVAPPLDRTDAASAEPFPLLSSRDLPAGFSGADCPRRECPLPEGVVEELVIRLGDRLAEERRQAVRARASLERQRRAFIDALCRMLRERDRRAVRVGADADAGLSASAAEWAAWLRSSPAVADLPASPESSGRIRSSPGAGPVGPVREGRWILPLVGGWARLREAFDAAVAERHEAAALANVLRAVEFRVAVRRQRLTAAWPPVGPTEPPALRPARGAPPGSIAAGQRSLREALRLAWEDLDRLIDSLDRSRAPECGRVVGSAVCVPPPIPVWSGGEFLVEGAQGSDEAMLRALDGLLGTGEPEHETVR